MISVEGEHKNEALYYREIQKKRRLGRDASRHYSFSLIHLKICCATVDGEGNFT